MLAGIPAEIRREKLLDPLPLDQPKIYLFLISKKNCDQFSTYKSTSLSPIPALHLFKIYPKFSLKI